MTDDEMWKVLQARGIAKAITEGKPYGRPRAGTTRQVPPGVGASWAWTDLALKVIRLRETGLSYRKIAKAVGTNKSTVRRILLSKEGLPPEWRRG